MGQTRRTRPSISCSPEALIARIAPAPQGPFKSALPGGGLPSPGGGGGGVGGLRDYCVLDCILTVPPRSPPDACPASVASRPARISVAHAGDGVSAAGGAAAAVGGSNGSASAADGGVGEGGEGGAEGSQRPPPGRRRRGPEEARGERGRGDINNVGGGGGGSSSSGSSGRESKAGGKDASVLWVLDCLCWNGLRWARAGAGLRTRARVCASVCLRCAEHVPVTEARARAQICKHNAHARTQTHDSLFDSPFDFRRFWLADRLPPPPKQVHNTGIRLIKCFDNNCIRIFATSCSPTASHPLKPVHNTCIRTDDMSKSPLIPQECPPPIVAQIGAICRLQRRRQSRRQSRRLHLPGCYRLRRLRRTPRNLRRTIMRTHENWPALALRIVIAPRLRAAAALTRPPPPASMHSRMLACVCARASTPLADSLTPRANARATAQINTPRRRAETQAGARRPAAAGFPPGPGRPVLARRIARRCRCQPPHTPPLTTNTTTHHHHHLWSTTHHYYHHPLLPPPPHRHPNPPPGPPPPPPLHGREKRKSWSEQE
jgi:hypothetical protein